MAEIAGALMSAVSLGMTALTTIRQKNIADDNADREKTLAQERAKERDLEYRRTVAAQRVALVGQGRDPDLGSSLTLQQQTYDAIQREGHLDDFQTGAVLSNYRNAAVDAVANGVGKAAGTVSAYTDAKYQASLKKDKSNQTIGEDAKNWSGY